MMKFSTPSLHIKSLEENGEISGYASVFNVVDSYSDVVVGGAFKNAVEDFKMGKKPKFLWQHDRNTPIGVWEEIREDDYGLFVRGRLLMEVPKAKEVYSLLKNKAIDGFSIGYKIKNNRFEDNKQYLTDIDLMEVSVVTFPACAEAIVGDVKSDEKTKKEEKEMTKNENEIEKKEDKIMFSKEQVEELQKKMQDEMRKELKQTLCYSKEIEEQLGGNWSDVACDREALSKKFFALFGIDEGEDALATALKVLKKSKQLFSKVSINMDEIKKASGNDISMTKIDEFLNRSSETAKKIYTKGV